MLPHSRHLLENNRIKKCNVVAEQFFLLKCIFPLLCGKREAKQMVEESFYIPFLSWDALDFFSTFHLIHMKRNLLLKILHSSGEARHIKYINSICIHFAFESWVYKPILLLIHKPNKKMDWRTLDVYPCNPRRKEVGKYLWSDQVFSTLVFYVQ